MFHSKWAVFCLACLGLINGGTTAYAQRIEINDKYAQPVLIESVDVKSEVSGAFALTTLELVFHNPNDRVLEGTFSFPLLDGQTVVGFALDIDGKLRAAVPVEETRAKVIFEDIERRNVDPGLLEQTDGNNYRVRVYPIPANGSRRVSIFYQENIAKQGAKKPKYRLALDYPSRLKRFRLSVLAQTGTRTPADVKTTLDLKLPEWSSAQSITVERENFHAKGVLELTLPKTDAPLVITGKHDDAEYFCANVPLKIAPSPRAKPKAIAILWDASGSGEKRDHERELRFLGEWFKQVRDVDVSLIFLRDRPSAPTSFAIRKGNWRALENALQQTVYDGATALNALGQTPACDEWLIFSDGLFNFGDEMSAIAISSTQTVHCISSAVGADPYALRGLALRQNGEYVNLLKMAPAPAAKAIRSRAPRISRITCTKGEIDDVFPQVGAPLSEDGLGVTGRLRSADAVLRVELDGPTPAVELHVQSGANTSPLAARAWAAAKIETILMTDRKNTADVRALGLAFGVVTPGTSLLVLETVEDYLRYEVQPPEELRKEFEKMRESRSQTKEEARQQHLKDLILRYQDRVEWWKTDFSKAREPKLGLHFSGSAQDKPRLVLVNFTPSQTGVPTPADIPQPAPGRSVLWGRVLDGRQRLNLLGALVSIEGTNTSATADRTGRYIFPDLTPGEVTVTANYPGYDPVSETVTLLADQVQQHDFALGFDTGDTIKLEAFAVASVKEGMSAKRTAGGTSDAITLQPWSADAPYLDELREAPPEKTYDVYLKLRSEYAQTPGFFVDAAEVFFERNDLATAVRILSNLAELGVEDAAVLRVLGYRLLEAQQLDLAIRVFEKVVEIRSFEPQSYRDLAIACSKAKQYQRAVDLLWTVASRVWDDRFADTDVIALTELNAIAATCGEPLDLSKIDPQLRINLPSQLRIVLTWDSDDCDIDLWVTDPFGETAIYNHPRTVQGGHMSDDATDGYGPEEFLLREAAPGEYRVTANFYGDDRQNAVGPVTIKATVITGFGTPAQNEKTLIFRVTKPNDKLELGTIEIAPPTKI